MARVAPTVPPTHLAEAPAIAPAIAPAHFAEAIQNRKLDRGVEGKGGHFLPGIALTDSSKPMLARRLATFLTKSFYLLPDGGGLNSQEFFSSLPETSSAKDSAGTGVRGHACW